MNVRRCLKPCFKINMNNFFNHVKQHFDVFSRSIFPSLQQELVKQKSPTKIRNVIHFSTKYLDGRLQRKINKDLFWRTQYSAKLDNIHVEVNIHSPNMNIKQDECILFTLLFVVYYCNKVKPVLSKISLNINIVLSKYKKLIRKSGQLSAYNVNSGVTSYNILYSKEHNILVFRREEVLKVLIHEIIHAMRLDASTIDMDSTSIDMYFGSRNPLNINESFTETYACLLNIVLATLVLGGETMRFKRLLRQEKLFIGNQARKVLNILGFVVKKGKLQAQTNYNEEISVVSYYLLKNVNFSFIEDFLFFLEQEGYYLKDTKMYVKLLIENLQRIRWRKINDQSTTMRMTSFDLLDILVEYDKAYKTFD